MIVPIPDFQTLMRPVLAHLADGEVRRSREVKEAMANHYDLTAAERAEMIPSGRARLMDNRVGWALTYLAQAGLVVRPVRGQVRITDAGTKALAEYPERIDMKVLEAFPGYRAFKARTRTISDSPTQPEDVSASSSATPQELVEAAGVDGVISQDPLGLDRIYVQAQRYAVERTVDRPGSTSSPVRCWASRVTAGCSSRRRRSRRGRRPRRNGSTRASS